MKEEWSGQKKELKKEAGRKGQREGPEKGVRRWPEGTGGRR